MKLNRILSCVVMLSMGMAAHAQYYYQDSKNSEMLRHAERHEPCRKEITLPKKVNGYNVYKADLHSHTVFSDGQVLPSFRVQEAWQDGLDIIAITDHLEIRKYEETMYDYMKAYTDKEYLSRTKGVENGMIDLNFSVRLAQEEAAKIGMVVIPGTEISRAGATVGHFNALFTTDNNTIYDADAVQSMRNARAQGALVMHNHPGWRRTSIGMTEVETVAYEEGLINGVEVMNGKEFYPGIIDRVRERGLFIASNSDIHFSTANDYRITGHLRNMTFILAEDSSLESIKEALLARRAIAFGYNTLCGEEQILTDFFKASVRVVPVPGQEDVCMLTNLTSIPYVLKRGNGNPFRLDPFSTIKTSVSKKTGLMEMTLINVWTGVDSHLKVSLPAEWNVD